MTRVPRKGFVWLVGAGPGDPELLTLKARRIIETADAIVHDALSPREVLAWARPGAELHDVGKRCGRACRAQPEINALLVRLARAGRHVVRLKGGDPLVFGRGGEELAALAAAGIPCEVVPGVTAACAAAAAAQVSLTERGRCRAVVLATGHEAPALPGHAVRWADYAKLDATLCIYMGRHRAGKISAELQAGGLAADTSVLLVAAAATPAQLILPATLGTMAAVAESAETSGPMLILVGDVARSPGEAATRPAGKPVARAAALAMSPA